jgi:hypothetical protein
MTGSDWYNYRSDYEAGCANENFEIGYAAACKAFSLAGIGFWSFVFFIKIYYFLVLTWFVSKVGAPALAPVAIYIIISPVLLENLLRQQLAAAFVLLAYLSIRQSVVRFFLLGAAACLFHISAAFCMPIYLLYKYARVRAFFLAVACLFFLLHATGLFLISDTIGVVASAMPDSVFSRKILLYTNFDRYPVTMGHYLRFLILMIFTILYYRNRYRLTSLHAHWLTLIYSSTLLMLFYEMVFYDFGVFWMRVREFFTIFIILFPLYLTKHYYPRAVVGVYVATFLYAAFVFYGFYSLPVFDELYSDYKNYIYESLFSDERFNQEREMTVSEYWRLWQQGNIR